MSIFLTKIALFQMGVSYLIYSKNFYLFLFCNQLIFQEHLKQEHPNPVCEFCGEKFNSTIRLEEHKQKECTKITVPCPLKDYGCLISVS